jgi:hypothetical protein
LREHSFTIDHSRFCQSVHAEFCRMHNRNPAAVPIQKLGDETWDIPEVREYRDELQTWFWTHGQTPEFKHSLREKFALPGGQLSVIIDILSKEGFIKDCKLVECESLDQDVDRLEAILHDVVSGLMQNQRIAYDYEPVAQVFDRSITRAVEHGLLEEGEDVNRVVMEIRDWLISSL